MGRFKSGRGWFSLGNTAAVCVVVSAVSAVAAAWLTTVIVHGRTAAKIAEIRKDHIQAMDLVKAGYESEARADADKAHEKLEQAETRRGLEVSAAEERAREALEALRGELEVAHQKLELAKPKRMEGERELTGAANILWGSRLVASFDEAGFASQSGGIAQYLESDEGEYFFLEIWSRLLRPSLWLDVDPMSDSEFGRMAADAGVFISELEKADPEFAGGSRECWEAIYNELKRQQRMGGSVRKTLQAVYEGLVHLRGGAKTGDVRAIQAEFKYLPSTP